MTGGRAIHQNQVNGDLLGLYCTKNGGERGAGEEKKLLA